jgi:hypothetical protein
VFTSDGYRGYVPTFVLRVWVPDRPGALGSVASRIGAVRGDLVGIDILERGGGRAIDELVVDLPDAALVPLLLTEVGQVDGVDVEDVRPAPPSLNDPRLDALETAALLVEQGDIDALLVTLATHARHDFEADWGAVIDAAAAVPLAAVGSPPPVAWLAAFVTGSQSSVRVASGESGPDDTAWATLQSADLALIVGRRGRPFRARERRQLNALARVASSRWAELARVHT